jgi:hypothetical protein
VVAIIQAANLLQVVAVELAAANCTGKQTRYFRE